MLNKNQLHELSGTLAAFTILGIIAIWGGKGFYPFWLICAVIYLYHVVENYLLIDRSNHTFFILLEIVYYTIISPFWLLMATYRLLIILVEVWLETRDGSKKQT